MTDPNVPREKYFYSYRTVMNELKISRRTLQRWIDDMNIHPLEFEDHLKVFLVLPNMQLLRAYKKVMKTRKLSLINRFRAACDRGEDTSAILQEIDERFS